jgi:hypothetical protein
MGVDAEDECCSYEETWNIRKASMWMGAMIGHHHKYL